MLLAKFGLLLAAGLTLLHLAIIQPVRFTIFASNAPALGAGASTNVDCTHLMMRLETAERRVAALKRRLSRQNVQLAAARLEVRKARLEMMDENSFGDPEAFR